MKAFILTEEDIENIFLLWMEDRLSGKALPPNNKILEDMLEYQVKCFTAFAIKLNCKHQDKNEDT